MARIFLLSAFLIALTISLGPGVSVLSAQSDSADLKRKKAAEDMIKLMREEFAEFMEDYQKYTSDPASIRKEERAIQKKIDEFISNLEAHSMDPYAAKDNLDLWLETRRMEAVESAESNLKRREFGVKVFFGGWAVFFLAIAILFIVLFMFNILQGIFYSARNYIFGLFGLRFTRVHDHLSPVSRVDIIESESAPQAKDSKSSSAPSRPVKDNALFCRVFTSLIKPNTELSAIEAILNYQKQLDSPPMIGQLLKERGLANEEEIQETLYKQKMCRSSNRLASYPRRRNITGSKGGFGQQTSPLPKGVKPSKFYSPRPYLPRR